MSSSERQKTTNNQTGVSEARAAPCTIFCTPNQPCIFRRVTNVTRGLGGPTMAHFKHAEGEFLLYFFFIRQTGTGTREPGTTVILRHLRPPNLEWFERVVRMQRLHNKPFTMTIINKLQ